MYFLKEFFQQFSRKFDKIYRVLISDAIFMFLFSEKVFYCCIVIFGN